MFAELNLFFFYSYPRTEIQVHCLHLLRKKMSELRQVRKQLLFFELRKKIKSLIFLNCFFQKQIEIFFNFDWSSISKTSFHCCNVFTIMFSNNTEWKNIKTITNFRLFVDEAESVRRQLLRGELARQHNLKVAETGIGELLPVYTTKKNKFVEIWFYFIFSKLKGERNRCWWCCCT